LCDDATFPACKGSSSIIEREKKFRSLAFAFFPQSKGFLHRVFFGVQPSALNSAAYERLLI
jgi:hypothetical protein